MCYCKPYCERGDCAPEKVESPTMNDLKPVAWLSKGGDVSRSKAHLAELGFGIDCPLYAIPSTHRVVSVALLELFAKYTSVIEIEVAIRAIIDNKGE